MTHWKVIVKNDFVKIHLKICWQIFFLPGQVTAVVGPSGSGKSTIAALILRMYDVDNGYIQIDKTPVTELDPQWLRQNIGLVAQVWCFSNMIT